ncbi:TPA: DUF371 domain-containing protein [archaeon]|uniref:DUF371 domain-containing protein n=1 Tax=Candidatus Naiadarchaeum limnaeum TaxID=2756139 RepID=A0A832XM30_9ARCH|nr:DUF371 domain-containing protein [Candidatus Naiadarchaeum limnaeum]
MVKETIIARGHPNVLGIHRTTIEITKESHLTHKGDCIIGVNADKACSDLSDDLKKELKKEKKFEIILRAGDSEERITGFGSPNLLLSHRDDIILRKSSYIDARTLLIKCDKACSDLNRGFVNKLKDPNTKIEMIISC